MDEKSAYLIGGGIASLARWGFFLIRDGQMDGKRITIYEASNICGGGLDGIKDPKEGYLFRGVLARDGGPLRCPLVWMRSIPSIDAGASVLEEFYRINT